MDDVYVMRNTMHVIHENANTIDIRLNGQRCKGVDRFRVCSYNSLDIYLKKAALSVLEVRC